MTETPTTGIARLLNEARFNVPQNQRDYSWTEDHIETLFSDIQSAMTDGASDYFIGLMVFMPSTDRQFTILDGQQRIVTTILILAAIRTWLKARDFKEDAEQIQRDYIAERPLGEREYTPRVQLNQYNHPIFQRYVVTESPDEDVRDELKKQKKHSPNKALLEAILFCRRRIAEIAKNAGAAPEKALFDMVNFLQRNVKVVRLHVPNESNAFTVFETLNDRGLDTLRGGR